MARFAVLLVALLCASIAVAQNTFILDRFDVSQSTLSSNSAGVVANYNCGPTSGLAGGIRKLSITAPAGTNVGNSIQLGVFIPTGQTTAPNGASSGNNNLQSPSFQILYRLDGQSSLCSSGTNTVSTTAISKTTNNLNINLQSIGAFAFQFNAQGDVTPNTVTVIMYTPSGSVLAQSNPVNVVETGQTPTFDAYVLPFSDASKWTSSSSFTGTVGAIELTWAVPANLQFAVNLVEFQVQSTVSVGATVFLDCGCNGFQSGSGDTLQSGVTVTLAVSGAGCTASSSSLTTGSTGSVTFTSVPGGCTYTLSTSGLTLCSNSAATQTVTAGGSANFAILGTVGSLTIPPSTTVPCGTDTSPTTTGTASVTGGSCGGTGGGTATFVDTVTPSQCTPGGSISVISRAWTGSGSTQTQTITVKDTQSLTFTNVPASTTIQCNDNIPTTTATATSCTAVTVTSADSTAAGTCDTTTCTSSSTITRTFTARDACGNTKTATQTIARAGCATSCPPPPPPSVPPPPTTAPPPPTNLPTNANCRFICDDDDSSAAKVLASVAVLLLAALAAF